MAKDANGISRVRFNTKSPPGSRDCGGLKVELSYLRLRLIASGGSGCPLGLGQHHAGLLAGPGVDVVVAEEGLRGRSAGSAVLGHIVSTDVDDGGVWLLDQFHGGGLAVGAGHAVGLAFGSLNDQEDTAVVGDGLVQFEGEGVAAANHGGPGRVLHAHQLGRSHLGLAAADDNPVVEAGEEVGTGDLCLGAQHGTAFLGEGQFVPGEQLGLLAKDRLTGGMLRQFLPGVHLLLGQRLVRLGNLGNEGLASSAREKWTVVKK